MAADLQYDGGLVCALGVKDVRKSIDWYREHLGFELSFHVEEAGWAEVRSSVPGVAVGFSEVAEPRPEGGATMTFGVRDVARAKGLLEEKGVRFDGDIVEYPGLVRLATLYDLDGHKIMLYESLMEASS